MIVIFAMLPMYACGPRTDAPDSLPEADKRATWPDQRMDRWLSYYGFEKEEFTDSATYAKPYRLEKQTFDFSREDPFSELYVFNSDSTLAIDLDSYHLVLEKDQQGMLFTPGRSPDMEIGLIDLAESKRERLLFCGPACLFEEGSFHPRGHIVIAGFSQNGEGYLPTIWIVDPAADSLRVKNIPEPYKPEKINYLPDVRLKHIRFYNDDGSPVTAGMQAVILSKNYKKPHGASCLMYNIPDPMAGI